MSQLRERKQKNCLNCNAEVHGKYCHVCGQENLEPSETLWQLSTHFFNDITHFDGKFFGTLGLLLTRPGFLSAEYKMGRRNSYLNPVRMYIFTSFIFFFIFFLLLKPGKDVLEISVTVQSVEQLNSLDNNQYESFVNEVKKSDEKKLAAISENIYPAAKNNRNALLHFIDSTRNVAVTTMAKVPFLRLSGLNTIEYKKLLSITSEMDSTEFANFSKSMYDDTALSKEQFRYLADSLRATNRNIIKVGKTNYKDKATYDSLTKTGAIKENWIWQKIRQQQFEINDKYADQQSAMWKQVIELLTHYFPQMLFVSLPLFAFTLYLLYKRNDSFYFVSHGIFAVHLYITYFIVLFLLILSSKLEDVYAWKWLQWGYIFLILFLFWYEYKAMRHFYGQGRAKTIFKFILAFGIRFFILLLLLFLFFILSLINAS
ncbi:MAG: DUF3667 domain-containing protein [Ferruginibacter sp.]